MSLQDGTQASARPSMHQCVHTSKHEYISEISWPIVSKFHMEHHWGSGLAALALAPSFFGTIRQDRIRTLVSMATANSHRVIMGKTL